MSNALTWEMANDLLFIAGRDAVRASELDDHGATLIAAGLLVAEGGRLVLTLDGCDAVDAIRRGARGVTDGPPYLLA